jgi:hypothetical protein
LLVPREQGVCECGYLFVGNEPEAVPNSDDIISIAERDPLARASKASSARTSPYCRIAFLLVGLLLVVGALGIAVAKVRNDGFFLLGFMGAYAIAVVLVVPVSAIFTIVSLVRREPAGTASLLLLVFLLLLSGYAARSVYRTITQPVRLFQ